MVGLLLCGLTFGQPGSNMARIMQEALANARVVVRGPAYASARKIRDGCVPEPKRLYTGKPFLIRSLIQLTQRDPERLQLRINEARTKDPDFVVAVEKGWLRNYRDTYRVPIFDRACGFLFDTWKYGPGQTMEVLAGGPRPLNKQEAQRQLESTKAPTFVRLISPLHDGFVWIAGSKAVEVYGKHTVYRIVDRSGKPVRPLETKLKPTIFGEPFTTSMGKPSAFWHFQLPMRLEPLSPR